MPPPSLFRFSLPKRLCVRDATRIGALLLFILPVQFGQYVSRRKLFTSSEDGVSFFYPAAWLLNADDDAATAKLRIAGLAPAHAVIQLEGNFTGEGPYKSTDFDAGAFAYTVVPIDTEAACSALVDRLADRQGTSTRIGLTNAYEAHFSATVAGTADIHHLIGAPVKDRCLLFETTLIRRSADAVDHPLDAVHWLRIEHAFDTVLHSVRLTATRVPHS